ncbi:hypothetical protein [Desulfovibrio psychrotolerans]|uniref:Uncharacterized protein n=1 Tax=Desulfovibrio psychrotolerans TaxID=415242 RepID=A0A7J0BWY7_9BACT|nr:hypothetical protein [Desulfovibrio psychrotolerans]GFM38229.1 hypothetical protein DSM19430T_29130 [Desulfovibrio psychrotolerans]
MHMFINCRNGRFWSNQVDLGSELNGPMTIAGKRFLKWKQGGGLPESMPCNDERECPPGWVVAYDLQILHAGQAYILTVSGKALEIALLPYLRWLEDMHCSLGDVRTVVTAQDADTYTFLKFGIGIVQYPG